MLFLSSIPFKLVSDRIVQINIERTRPSSLDIFDRFGFVDCRFDKGWELGTRLLALRQRERHYANENDLGSGNG